jgi:hypothetical protein
MPEDYMAVVLMHTCTTCTSVLEYLLAIQQRKGCVYERVYIVS